MTKKNAGRKQKASRRKEQQQVADRQIFALQSAVAKAKLAADHLDALKAFKKYDRAGLNVIIESGAAHSFDERIRNWAFDLTKANMEALYAAEWNDNRKRQELSDQDAFYLVATEDCKPVAFLHYRFELYYDSAVVYCYELQCERTVQRKGLGKFLMQILQLIAFTYGMSKVVLTCFKHNERAQSFYRDKLGFTVDSSDPEGEFDCNYYILSKAIAERKVCASTCPCPAEHHA